MAQSSYMQDHIIVVDKFYTKLQNKEEMKRYPLCVNICRHEEKGPDQKRHLRAV